MNNAISEDQYRTSNHLAAMIANSIEGLPLDAMLEVIGHAQAIGPFLDPTAFIRKGDDLMIDERRLRILQRAQKDLQELRRDAEQRNAARKER